MSNQNPSTHDYLNGPCYSELIAVIVAGIVHVAAELALSKAWSRASNVFACLGFLAYVLWRMAHTDNVLFLWGISGENFWEAMGLQSMFGAVAALSLLAFAQVTGLRALPKTFWLTVALYPVYGIVQQFALQNLIARNLRELLGHSLLVALVASLLFALAHYPRIRLVLLAFLGGFFFTLIYQSVPNLWAVGIVHGIVGGMSMYIVLREDPGGRILAHLPGSNRIDEPAARETEH